VGHLARIGTGVEMKVTLLPTVTRGLLPNLINIDFESDPDQVQITSSPPTPSKTNILLQGKLGPKPPRFVGELNETFNPIPSSLKIALWKVGVGGSERGEVTIKVLSPEYTIE
jgi:hypothetical protein